MIECPLCNGAGELSRAEILDRLGVKDFARVAQLSAEEAFRLLHDQHQQDGEALWARFQAELTKRTSEIEQQHRDEIHSLSARAQERESAARTTEQQKAYEIQDAKAGRGHASRTCQRQGTKSGTRTSDVEGRT
jgi:hypothetical protein